MLYYSTSLFSGRPKCYCTCCLAGFRPSRSFVVHPDAFMTLFNLPCPSHYSSTWSDIAQSSTKSYLIWVAPNYFIVEQNFYGFTRMSYSLVQQWWSFPGKGTSVGRNQLRHLCISVREELVEVAIRCFEHIYTPQSRWDVGLHHACSERNY